MPIIGFNFNKIYVERKKLPRGRVSVNNNVSIKDIKEADIPIDKTKQGALKIVFEFSSKYEPEIGEILLSGDLLLIEDINKLKQILKEWEDSKKVSTQVMNKILNTILTKCNIQALILSQTVNLPPPIPLPKIQQK